MTLRDDMTLAEAQAEAGRRWPGATIEPRYQEPGEDLCLRIVGEHLDHFYVAVTPVGCLDQAIAAEARRAPCQHQGVELHWAEGFPMLSDGDDVLWGDIDGKGTRGMLRPRFCPMCGTSLATVRVKAADETHKQAAVSAFSGFPCDRCKAEVRFQSAPARDVAAQCPQCGRNFNVAEELAKRTP